jgi:UDP-N-acetylglucosamine 2-epimerase (non-hydrolysing)
MILIAFGTRPEWIKIRPVIQAIEGKIPYKLLFTGQHSSLVDEISHEFTHITLEVEDVCDMRLDSIVVSILRQIPSDMYGATHVMVQGDTTTVFAVALAAFHRQIPIIHLEAGLRTWDNKQPYPEEFNRQAVSGMADIHLCPTKFAMKNLINEGKHHSSEIYVVGNTALDNLVNQPVNEEVHILCTLHRRENHKQIRKWFKAIDLLAEQYTEFRWVLPIHPNPNVLKYKDVLKHVEVVDPLPHHYLLKILKSSRLVITDSGGIQEEAAFFKKPCIVCRNKTERQEGIGEFSWLCKRPRELVNLFNILKDHNINESLLCPYGDGNASEKILKILESENV